MAVEEIFLLGIFMCTYVRTSPYVCMCVRVCKQASRLPMPETLCERVRGPGHPEETTADDFCYPEEMGEGSSYRSRSLNPTNCSSAQPAGGRGR